jgi:hypothetical protein
VETRCHPPKGHHARKRNSGFEREFKRILYMVKKHNDRVDKKHGNRMDEKHDDRTVVHSVAHYVAYRYFRTRT